MLSAVGGAVNGSRWQASTTVPSMDPSGLEARARAGLDPEAYALVADVAGDGHTAGRNEAAFQRRSLVRRVLRDVSRVDTSTVLQGTPVTAPLGIAPLPRMGAIHRDGERGLATAAAELGMVFCAAANSSLALEDLVASRPERPRPGA